MNQAKPTRSHQRDVLSNRKNHVLKNAAQRMTKNSVANIQAGPAPRTNAFGARASRTKTSAKTKELSRSAEIKPARSYSARHARKSPPKRPVNPSILMQAQPLLTSSSASQSNPRDIVDSLDEALRQHVAPQALSKVPSSNLFVSQSAPSSRASTPISDFEEAERMAEGLLQGGGANHAAGGQSGKAYGYAKDEGTSKPLNYKPYTLSEYRKNKPTKYVELGKLAPDLQTEELIQARAKKEKMKAFAENINKNNVRRMKVKPLAQRVKEQKEKKIIERTESKKERAVKYSRQVKRPEVPKHKVQPQRQQRKRRDEEMTSNSRYGDFEGSLYDDESLGFEGADGLQAGGGKKTSSPSRVKSDDILVTKVDQVQMANLEAENESARLQIERLKAEFGL